MGINLLIILLSFSIILLALVLHDVRKAIQLINSYLISLRLEVRELNIRCMILREKNENN